MSARSWTDEEVEEAKEFYLNGSTVFDIGDYFNKPYRSVIAVLVRYYPEIYKSVRGDKKKKRTYKALTRDLERILGIKFNYNIVNNSKLNRADSLAPDSTILGQRDNIELILDSLLEKIEGRSKAAPESSKENTFINENNSR